MAPVVVLDSGPVGLLSKARGNAEADRCLIWIRTLTAAGVRVVLPAIADYEVRRELLRVGATAGVGRLNRLRLVVDFDPITPGAMLLAADFWAQVRRIGVPTADKHALDGDCILAAQASLLVAPDEGVTIATTNVGHLGRFSRIHARPWETITMKI